MSRSRTGSLALLLGLALTSAAGALAQTPGSATAEARAVSYLAREVPRWSAEHRCFSCHNNGDGARALYHAARAALPVPAESLAETTRWLARPEAWDSNGGDPRAGDKGLARLQFAHALAAAVDAGRFEVDVLTAAAALVAQGQAPDGSWTIDAPGTLGSPATYGSALATAVARRVLARADAEGYRAPIAAAERWLRSSRSEAVLDAAAVLFGLAGARGAEAEMRRARDLLLRAQSRDGGWGPTTRSAPEPFDTAVVLLGLSTFERDPDAAAIVRRGRAYLAAAQLEDGSWQETTRPTRGESYAQRLSTTGWALVALIATR